MQERISDAELAIMEALWAESPLTATDVAARVQGERGWSLTTVKTLLSRLLAKAAVGHSRDGRRFLYSPLVEREDYVTGESRRLVDRLFGGSNSCHWWRISPRRKSSADDEIAEIERLLEEMKS